MGRLVQGEWVSDDAAAASVDRQGRFVRKPSKFRDWVTADGSSGFRAERGRYHLFVSLACPWAHRSLILRKLKALEDAVSVTIVSPLMGDDGWEMKEPDPVTGARYLREVYVASDPSYTGRVTVPCLYDREERRIVNNESRDVIRMFDRAFDAFGDDSVHYFPAGEEEKVLEVIDENYGPVNNGVYRAGFARRQEAHEEAVTALFDKLDKWERVLGSQRYLLGDRITAADWCLFTTLFRFDAVYNCHFKCNLRRIVDYPNLWGYLRDLYQVPGVSEVCDLQECKEHYYRSHESVNPRRIVPIGPVLDFDAPHGRERLS